MFIFPSQPPLPGAEPVTLKTQKEIQFLDNSFCLKFLITVPV